MLLVGAAEGLQVRIIRVRSSVEINLHVLMWANMRSAFPQTGATFSKAKSRVSLPFSESSI